MAGYQFIHLECYARRGSEQRQSDRNGKAKVERKRSAVEIAAEAAREDGACPHIADPQPPRQLCGVSPQEAADEAAKWADAQRDAKGRKLRADGLCLLAGVVSLPREREQDWPNFRDATINWLHHQYGERLRSVVEHVDEAHPHIHFYAIPRLGESFDSLHIGRTAAANAKVDGGKKGAQNAAYISAMRQWQDQFYQEVAANHGLTRIGPKRRRLSRAGWKAEQNAAEIAAQQKALDKSLRELQPRAFEPAAMIPEKEWSFLGLKEPTYTVAEVVAMVDSAHKTGVESGQASAVDSMLEQFAAAEKIAEKKDREIENLKTELERANAHLKRIEQIISPEELQDKLDDLNKKKCERELSIIRNAQKQIGDYLDFVAMDNRKTEESDDDICKSSPDNDLSI